MADIIALDKKRRLSHDKEAALQRRHKILAVRKIFHCTHCASKCEKCGTQIGVTHDPSRCQNSAPEIPYHLCQSCVMEYLDYVQRLKGGGNPDYYWHNQAWQDSWKAWIQYQETVNRYLRSEEFNQLLKELKQ